MEATIKINKSDYSCKKMKEMEGHDGYVIRFDLCYKGKKVAEVYDDGNGGMIEFEWKKYSAKLNAPDFYKYGAKEDFDALVEQMGSYEFNGRMSKYNDEILVMEIYEDARFGKELKKKLKKTVMAFNGKNELMQWGFKGNPTINQRNIDHIKYKNKDIVGLTLNELPFDMALEAYKKGVSCA